MARGIPANHSPRRKKLSAAAVSKCPRIGSNIPRNARLAADQYEMTGSGEGSGEVIGGKLPPETASSQASARVPVTGRQAATHSVLL